jgi:tungstate transport system ATP-binding protein
MLKPPELANAHASTVASLFPLVTSGLTFADRNRTLIEDVSITLDGRGITAVMGANGAGKSLMLRLLHGLLKPTCGTITWGGQPMDDTIRARQAMVFQRPTMLRRSAADNLRFVLARLLRTERDARVAALISEAKLEHAASTPARLLSGGEQQRLAIARARAVEPELLFLDEPAASLDPAATQTVEEFVRDIHNEGIKVILVTHDVGQAKRLADDVLFLNRGRVVEQAPASEFFRRPATEAARAYLEGRLSF